MIKINWRGNEVKKALWRLMILNEESYSNETMKKLMNSEKKWQRVTGLSNKVAFGIISI